METDATDETSIARAAIEQCVEVQRGLLDRVTLAAVVDAADLINHAFAQGGKVLLFGNGGSASDASHVATEFVGRFMAERRALPALSLSSDDSAVTAIANDYGFARVFARQLEALGNQGDVAVAISTSGRSANVLEGVRTARDLGMTSIGLTGADGGELALAVDICLRVPSSVTARIQEGHILLAHVLCELVERRLG
jgi:D-sedoheptulose 7-phosphate isomerase